MKIGIVVTDRSSRPRAILLLVYYTLLIPQCRLHIIVHSRLLALISVETLKRAKDQTQFISSCRALNSRGGPNYTRVSCNRITGFHLYIQRNRANRHRH